MADERSSVSQYFGSVAQVRKTTVGLIDGLLAAEGEALLHGQQDLADAEEADDRDEEVESAQELDRTEGHTELTGHRVHADRGQQEADDERDDDLVLVLTAEANKGAEGQEIDREELRWSEPDGEARDERRQESDQRQPRRRNRRRTR